MSEEAIERVIRHEHGRLVASLVRVFGMHNLELAEDVVQDAVCRALEVWRFHGVPPNPGAWLALAARRRAIDVLRKRKTAQSFAPELGRLLDTEWTLSYAVADIVKDEPIKDDELRMMFSCCHPSVPEKAQIALILNVLCGFSIKETGAAFLDAPAAMEKRLQRAKANLAEAELFTLTSAEISSRRDTVLRALYLMYSEGYHGSTQAVREDLCGEAMRLTLLLTKHPASDVPEAHALLALMCLHSARLPARIEDGVLVPLRDQDRSKIDQAFVARGVALLESAAVGDRLSEYHLEAAIAAEHVLAPSVEQTDFSEIVRLYDALLSLKRTPIVELNRAIAIAEARSPEEGLAALDSIDGVQTIESYPFFAAARAEMLVRSGRKNEARSCFLEASKLARTDGERAFFARRLATI